MQDELATIAKQQAAMDKMRADEKAAYAEARGAGSSPTVLVRGAMYDVRLTRKLRINTTHGRMECFFVVVHGTIYRFIRIASQIMR